MHNPNAYLEMAKLRHKDLLDEARRERLVREAGGRPGIHPGVIVGLLLAGIIVVALSDPVVVLPQDSQLFDLLGAII